MALSNVLTCLYAASLLLAAPAATSKPVVDDPKVWSKKVQKAYEGVKDYTASFEQQSTLKGAGTAGPKANGTVFIQKPGKMRWEFVAPEKKTFVSDGKTMWMYDAEENQVIVNEHMGQTTSLTALNFLEGLGKLDKEFNVAMATAPKDASDPAAAFLKLTPKADTDVQVKEIVLSIDRKKNLANEVFLIDGLGNVTRLSFKDAKTNTAIKAETFTFVIPKGAEVIKPTLLD